MDLVQALQASWLAGVLQSRAWVWPAIEIAHLFGLISLFGALIIVDLKVLGFAPALSFDAAKRLIPFALVGFAISVVTGSLLVLGDPKHFLMNAGFWAKMALIAVAGCNAAFFNLYTRSHHRTPTDGFGTAACISAGLSLLMWAGITAMARFISFIEPFHG